MSRLIPIALLGLTASLILAACDEGRANGGPTPPQPSANGYVGTVLPEEQRPAGGCAEVEFEGQGRQMISPSMVANQASGSSAQRRQPAEMRSRSAVVPSPWSTIWRAK